MKRHLPIGGFATTCSILLLLLSLVSTGAVFAGDEEPEAFFVRKGFSGDLANLPSIFGGGTYLGVHLLDLTPELRAHFGVDGETGVMVSKVEEDSPAAKAGLSAGDIITFIDGNAMGSSRAIAKLIRSKEEGNSVEIEYQRGSTQDSTFAEVGSREGHGGLNNWVLDIQDLGKNRALFEGSESIRDALQHLNTNGLEEALEAAGEALGGMDWSQYVEKLESFDFGTLEERMEKLQEKMKDLEKRLEEDYDGE